MRRHRTDGISLGFGTFFLLIAAWWAVTQAVDVELAVLGWTTAAVLILFGVIGLLGAIRAGRPEVREPVPAEAVVETPGGLPPHVHAAIVQELLDDPADKFQREHGTVARSAEPAPQPAPQPSQNPVEKPAPHEPRRD